MTIKTFDANRVGGGTFQLEQNATTGEYTIKEVGFVKLPELKLPEIDQAAPIIPNVSNPDPDPVSSDPSNVSSTNVGGGNGQDQTFTDFDYTGTQQYQNIQEEAAGGDLMKEATALSKKDTGIQVENIGNDPEQNSALISYNQSLKVYNDAIAKADTSNPNEMKNVDEAKALVDRSREFYEKSISPGGLFFEGTMKDAPIGDFSKGPRTVPTGTLTGARTPIAQGTFTKESIDKSFLSEEGPSQNLITKAKEVVSNSKPVQVLGIGLRLAATTLNNLTTSPQQQALNTSNKNAISSLGYKTRGELGGSTDPGRIAGNPADNVFAGMNAQSARGNIMTGSANRIKTRETVGIQRVEAKYGKNSQKAKDFRQTTQNFRDQRQEVFDAKEKEQAAINKATMNQGPPGQGSGGGNGSSGGGGKSIVCTAMYQTTGLQDWAKAMKIWYIYQKRYLTIQHQEGYHKLFKPFVKAMHKNNIIKIIGAHFAKHRTQHLKHIMFNSKPSLLGKIYNKILEPICYWVGRK